MQAGEGGRAISLLEPWRERIGSQPESVQEAVYALLAYGYTSTKKLTTAEEIVNDGLSRWSDSLDLLYFATYLPLALHEFKNAVECAVRYRRLYECFPETPRGRLDFSYTAEHLSNVCNYAGSACYEMGMLEEGERWLRDAIQVDPGSTFPYANLSRLLERAGRESEAEEILAKGQVSARESHDLTLHRRAREARVTVSACMIVKNEEAMLSACLDSIRDWVDEIIIVDTGSTDRTVEIAAQYGARVFHQPWEGNFSKHRNYSLEQATCDWVLIIDADERFVGEDLPRLQAALKRPDLSVLSVSVYNVYGANGETATFLPSIRLFRRSLGLRYEGIVHNALAVPDEIVVARVGVRIDHFGYDLSPEKMARKIERTKGLLEKQLAAEPNNAFAHFNYAQLLRGSKEGDRAEHIPVVLQSAGRAVELTNPANPREKHIHLMALNQLAWTYFFTREYTKAEAYAHRALAIKPGYLDPILLLAHVYVQSGRQEQAASQYRLYLDEQSQYRPHLETDNIILHHPDSRTSALYGISLIAIQAGDDATARQSLEKITLINPAYLDTNVRLGRLLQAAGDLHAASLCFSRQLEHNPDDRLALLSLGSLYLQQGKYGSASDCYQKVLAQNNIDLPALIGAGRAALVGGREKEASAHFSVALKSHASEMVVETVISEIRADSLPHAVAAKLYELLVKAGVNSSRVFTELGNSLFKTGNVAGARDAFHRAHHLDPESALIQYNLGLTEARSGNHGRAHQLFSNFLQLNPEVVEVQMLAADLSFTMKQFDRARDEYEMVLRLDPGNLTALFQLSDCYFNLKQFSAASRGFLRVVEIDPTHGKAAARLRQIGDKIAPTVSV